MVNEERQIDGRTIVVTGASRVIGLAIARTLSAAGARLFCISRAGQRLTDAVAALGYSAVAIPCDLSLPDEIDRAVATVLQQCDGPPDVLVQAAGVFPLAVVEKTTPR